MSYFKRKVLKSLKKNKNQLAFLIAQGDHMSAELDALTAEVTEMSGIVDSAITYIQGLGVIIESLKDDPAAISALAAELNEKGDALRAAITTNP
jgi:hypothetical protein